MPVYVGSARSASKGSLGVGDAGQKSIPDFDGEVSLQTMYGRSDGWKLIRPKDPALAAQLGALMVAACNNPNIGYNQANREGIFSVGIGTTTPTECDCSSLVCECVREASGVSVPSFTTAPTSEEPILQSTGLFQPTIQYSTSKNDGDPSMLQVGDILVSTNQGHTMIVVQTDSQGNGAIYGGMVDISSFDYSAESAMGVRNPVEFVPRTTAPILVSSASATVYDMEATADVGETEDAGKISGRVKRPATTKRVKYDGRDMWYVPASQGGWSPFEYLDSASYVWCRFSEIMDADPNNLLIKHEGCCLSMGMLADMYRHSEDGYDRNIAVTLGGVMCYYSRSNPSNGMAYIVEGMNGDSVDVSYWDSSNGFVFSGIPKRYGSWDFGDWVYQGCIHNPGVDMTAIVESALETFCRVAQEHIGEDVSWISSVTGITSNNSYSAPFIVACSKEAGSSLNIVVPNVSSVSSIGRTGILRNMGEWYDGPANGSNNLPEVGDIVIIRNDTYRQPSKYQGDLAGIVIQTSDGSMTIVYATNDIIRQTSYNTSNNRIAGYFRPRWEQIDGTSESVKLYRNISGLYSEGTSVEDACSREVGFLNSQYQPSIISSGIRLSVINYTGLLANMYSVFATSSMSDAADANLIVDLYTTYQGSGLLLAGGTSSFAGYDSTEGAYTDGAYVAFSIDPTQNAMLCYQELRNHGYSNAAACAILGNIKRESNFNGSAVGDKGTSFGLCQWHNNRGTAMKEFAGENWATNLSGQIGYLCQELETGYKKSVQIPLLNAPDTREGCAQCADIFVRKFEVPANVDVESSQYRIPYALGFWDSIVG